MELFTLFLDTYFCRNSQWEYNKQGHNLENLIRTAFDNRSPTIVFIVLTSHTSYFNTLPLHNRQNSCNTVYHSENGKSTAVATTSLTS